MFCLFCAFLCIQGLVDQNTGWTSNTKGWVIRVNKAIQGHPEAPHLCLASNEIRVPNSSSNLTSSQKPTIFGVATSLMHGMHSLWSGQPWQPLMPWLLFFSFNRSMFQLDSMHVLVLDTAFTCKSLLTLFTTSCLCCSAFVLFGEGKRPLPASAFPFYDTRHGSDACIWRDGGKWRVRTEEDKKATFCCCWRLQDL